MSKRIWILALLSHLLLIVLVAWREASALGWVISALLLLPLPGLIRQNTRTAAWASMLVMFYVAGYLAAGYADASARWSAFAMAALAGNRDAEIALLRLLDRSKRGDTATLCSLRQAPDRIAGLLADLRTRLRQGALMSIRPLGDEDRAQLLQKNAQQRGLQWSPEVSQWLLARLPRNPARLVAAVDALDRAALSARRRLSLSFVQKTLRQAGEFPPPANAQTSAG